MSEIKKYLKNKKKNNQENNTKVILYHGTNKDFDVFDKFRSGEKLTSLGIGFYLTPDKDLAATYGEIILSFEVDLKNVVDWENLTKKQRNEIEEELLKVVPESRISHFGEQKIEIVSINDDGRKRFQELKEKTIDAYNDYSKARILDDDDIEKYDPTLLKHIKDDEIVISWKENPDLKNANNQQLMTLMNEYHPNLIEELGYKSSKFSNQIAIYDSSLAKKINALNLKDKKNKKCKI